MYIKNDTIGVIFRVLFLIVCGAGLVMKLFASGFSLSVILGDFALLANALALVYFAYLIIARPSYERGFLRGAVTIYMVVTFLVYYYLNFGTGNGLHEGMSLAGYLLYFIAPLMAFIDYLLFCRKGEFTAYSPVFWAILPVLFNLLCQCMFIFPGDTHNFFQMFFQMFQPFIQIKFLHMRPASMQ